MKHNIIFLDVDGVINIPSSMMNINETFDLQTIKNLKSILSITSPKIVLSTAWRLYPKHKKTLIEELEKHGIPRQLIIGETPNLSLVGKGRESEILYWVNQHKNRINKWVAIDDLNLKLPSSNFVRTSFITGLTNDLAGEVISKLIF